MDEEKPVKPDSSVEMKDGTNCQEETKECANDDQEPVVVEHSEIKNSCEKVASSSSSSKEGDEQAANHAGAKSSFSFTNRAVLRKRLRPRPLSSSSSDSSDAMDAQQAGASDPEIPTGSDLIDTTSDSSDSLSDVRLDDTRSSDGAKSGEAEDPALAWTDSLCRPPSLNTSNCLSWLEKRSLGRKPNVPDGCRAFRQQLQGSPQMVGRWKLRCKLNEHEGCVNAVNFNESGSLIASGSDDLNVIIWDWFRKRVVCRFDSGHSANVFQSKFLPFSADLHIVSCARDGQVRLAQLSTSGACRNTRRLGTHRGSAHKLSLDPFSPHSFYSCGEDSAVMLFDVRESQPNKLFITKDRSTKVPLYSIHANPKKEFQFLTSGRDQFVRVYDRRFCSNNASDQPAMKFCPPHLNSSRGGFKHVTCAVFSNDGHGLIGSYNDDDIYLFDTAQKDGEEPLRQFRGHRNYATVKGVNFYGPNSEFVVSGSDCGNVFIWETATANVVNMFHADEGGVVNVLEPHPHDPVLATSGLDHDVKIWSPERENAVTANDLAEQVVKSAKKNARNRNSELDSEGDGSLPSMAWILMNALQRERRRNLRSHLAARGEDDDDDQDDTTSSSDDDSDNEEDGNADAPNGERRQRAVRIQCPQS